LGYTFTPSQLPPPALELLDELLELLELELEELLLELLEDELEELGELEELLILPSST